MTKAQAEYLAKAMGPKGYVARQIHGQWCVWSWVSDHVVEFDDRYLEMARVATASRNRCPLCAAGERHLSCG